MEDKEICIKYIKNSVEFALKKFYENDKELFDSIGLNDDDGKISINSNKTVNIKYASERCMVHRIAVYLEKWFPGLSVDCEYDRLGKSSKKDQNSNNIYTDLIVHKRGQKENILAIEVKKINNRDKNWHSDIERLMYMTNKNGNYGYTLGAFIVIGKENMAISYYKGGIPVDDKIHEIICSKENDKIERQIKQYIKNCAISWELFN